MKSIIRDALHNKKIIELNENLKLMIKDIYPNISDNDLITCYDYSGKKINLIINVNSEIKYISVRGTNNICLYKGNVKKLLNELLKINVSYKCILALLYYHYADGTCDGSGNMVSFGRLLEEDYKEQISIVNREFEDVNKYSKLLDFLLIKEKNEYSVDYFYLGNQKRGTIISSELLKRKILEYKDKYNHNFMRIGCVNFISLRKNASKSCCVLKMNLFKYIKK